MAWPNGKEAMSDRRVAGQFRLGLNVGEPLSVLKEITTLRADATKCARTDNLGLWVDPKPGHPAMGKQPELPFYPLDDGTTIVTP
jgi:hypothetical protein